MRYLDDVVAGNVCDFIKAAEELMISIELNRISHRFFYGDHRVYNQRTRRNYLIRTNYSVNPNKNYPYRRCDRSK